MKTNRIAFACISALALLTVAEIAVNVQWAAALSNATSSTTTVETTTTAQPVSISQALPGQGSIVGGLLAGSSSLTVLPSFATTTATATTTPGKGILSEHNKLSVTGSCVVKTSGNAKQCAIYETYTTATGDPVLGVPVTIATMNGEGMFMDVDGPLLLKNTSGKVVQYSGILPGVSAQDVATYVGPAAATSTLFVVLTPDGLRAQDTFASSTMMQ
jgi:hypothetical protein